MVVYPENRIQQTLLELKVPKTSIPQLTWGVRLARYLAVDVIWLGVEKSYMPPEVE